MGCPEQIPAPPLDLAFMIDPKFAQDPRPYYERLRQLPPQRHELEMDEGSEARWSWFLVLTTLIACCAARWSSPPNSVNPWGGLGNDRPMIPLQIDPPDHKKYRVLLDPYFAPRRMAELESDISQLVNQLIDAFIDRGSCELVSEFAVPLPCMFLRLLGLPLEHLDFFLGVKEGIVRANGESIRFARSRLDRRPAATATPISRRPSIAWNAVRWTACSAICSRPRSRASD